MRKLTALTLIAASGFLFANGNSASAEAKASVRIVAPVKIVSSSDMQFGAIVVDDVTQGAEVTMTTTHQGGMLNPAATLGGWSKCAPFKHQGQVSGAGFHYNYDVWAAGASNDGLKVSVPATITLTGGHGPDCTVTTNSSIPAVQCLGVSGLPTSIPGYTDSRHFGVGGKLTIPAGALGEKKGTFSVTVEYI